MRVIIRTDASAKIGSGHVMRCLTLADALAAKGASISFVSRELHGDLNAHIEEKGYQVYRLGKGDSFAAGLDECRDTGWQVDAKQMKTILASQDFPVDWLIVDHYALSSEWERCMREHVAKIMVIDDLADREHDCDLLLDQNYYGEPDTRYNELVPIHCKQLLGTRYAMLRSEFSSALTLKARRGRLERILIFFGATDSKNETLKALQAIYLLGCPKIVVDVILGVNFPFKSTVLDLVAKMPEKVTCHGYVHNMAELIAVSDLYLGAAGTTTWERCCLGLPSLVIAVAANQVGPMEQMGQAGIVRYLGEGRNVSAETISAALGEMLATPAVLMEMSRRGMMLVDGYGVQRCVLEIFNGGDVDGKAIQNHT